MAVICRKCGKTVSDKVNACYNCGELLQPPVKCAGCGRENVAGRKQCAYCGDPLQQPAAPAASAPVIGDPNAAAALSQLFGAAGGAPPAEAKPQRAGHTRMGFEDDAPKAPPRAPSAPAGSRPAPPPPATFEVLPAATSNQTMSLWTRDEIIDMTLLLLSLPAMVWGMMVMLGVILLTMMRGGPGLSTFFQRIINPHWAAFIFPGLLGCSVAYLISANTTPESEFLYRYAFIITAGSFGIGAWLVARRLMRKIKPRRSANDVFRV